MKFVCDRCKTRYSIGDDRVRGKILKIRCKNCANVITVREGMTADEPDPVQRSGRPTTGAPPAAHTANANGSAPKPPAALDEEWYVSIEGEQEGPYSLADAQRWISSKAFDAELHCWSEGFDDWLPVDKVSHFRGLRKKPAPPPVPRQQHRSAGHPVIAAPHVDDEDEPKPLFSATMAALEKSAPAATPTPSKAKATPASGIPSMPRGNGASASAPVAARNGTGPSAATNGKPTMMGPGSSPVPASPVGRSPSGPQTATPMAAPATPLPRTPSGPQAPPRVPDSIAPPTPAGVRSPSGAHAPIASATLPAPTRVRSPSGPQTPMSARAPGPFGSSPPGVVAKSGTGPASALDAPVRPLSGSGPATALKQPAPSTSVPGFDVGGDSATSVESPAYADPRPAAVPYTPPAPYVPPGGDDRDDHDAGATVPSDFGPKGEDDEMEIGEVSRVVKLADIVRTPKKDRTQPAPRLGRLSGNNPALPRVGGGTAPVNRISAASLAGPAGLGAPAQVAPGVDPMLQPMMAMDPAAEMAPMLDPSVVPPPVEVTHRRGMIVLLSLALLLIGSAVAVVIYIVTNNPDDTVKIGGNTGPGVDTTRVDDTNPIPQIFRPDTPDKQPDKNPHPQGNGGSSHPHPQGNGSQGKNPDNPPPNTPDANKPLDPGEVEDLATKGQFLTTRCWNLATKKQPFLPQDVKRASVTLQIDASGTVTSADLVGVPKDDGGLVGCLTTVIRGWHARQSKAGGTFKITLAFQ